MPDILWFQNYQYVNLLLFLLLKKKTFGVWMVTQFYNWGQL